ncbi:Frag1/DRAM/Sfk1 [Talaromyces proteolyticus]|uniref:Frag1/DRAM/Sfk1 n=1 Tax=Talaromyces proteolyticus TaxID=1131652 RepID=A0AAD4KNE3_9EURO|nr:Frag1/DRAM/Sfk1 [Talaromyces proteolyticus]KAH8694205.1 Frag1/DRAM/Sfk1 [Talaromyces proteolyticus]
MKNDLQLLWQPAIIFPTITVISWLAMLAVLFGSWYTSGEPRYVSEEDTQTIAFISDIGAQNLKPVFIACSTLAMSTYLPTIALYFYFLSPTHPHTGNRKSSPLSTLTRIGIPFLSSFFSLIGAVALILLTIFDTARFGVVHRRLLPASILSHILGCSLLCGWTFIRLHQHRQNTSLNGPGGILSGDKFTVELYALAPIPISMASLVIKSIVVAFEFGLVVLFATMTWWLKTFDTAAVMEWTVVLMFAGYMACQAVDMWMIIRTQNARIEVENEEPPIGIAI